MSEHKKEVPLKLDIGVQHVEVCSGEVVKVHAELTNTSTKDILVDPTMVWYTISFSTIRISSGKATGDNYLAIDEPGPEYEPDYIEIKPNGVLRVERTFNLKDEFFETNGKYRVQVTYGHFLEDCYGSELAWQGSVASNVARFEIQDCR
ncbi:MAG: hypothetical protein J5I65_12710 [Aridibacter famidurans]|nr:hypothetical protein [Aridibacter famidurans]